LILSVLNDFNDAVEGFNVERLCALPTALDHLVDEALPADQFAKSGNSCPGKRRAEPPFVRRLKPAVEDWLSGSPPKRFVKGPDTFVDRRRSH